jgi:hypothetical protein
MSKPTRNRDLSDMTLTAERLLPGSQAKRVVHRVPPPPGRFIEPGWRFRVEPGFTSVWRESGIGVAPRAAGLFEISCLSLCPQASILEIARWAAGRTGRPDATTEAGRPFSVAMRGSNELRIKHLDHLPGSHGT